MYGKVKFAWAALLAALLLSASPARAGKNSWSYTGEVGAGIRWFSDDAQWAGQSDSAGASLYANFDIRWRADRQRVSFKSFGRLDSLDDERSHVDLREAYWAYEGDDWELLLGLDKVFWGVTESRHLVDIINQTDLVEDPDGEQKLGQPMVKLSLQRDWGDVELFVMPYFRERTFAGESGRLRSPLPVNVDDPSYESSAEQWHTDLALRWSHFIGDADIGLHLFTGTGREPKIVPAGDSGSLRPYYHVINQLGVDFQYTRDAWLWKAEAIARDGLRDSFIAVVAGVEYTFFGVRNSGKDVGLLLEYLHDDRGPSEPVTPFDNDIFLGARLGFNDAQDTSVLVGVAMDLDANEWFFNLEAGRRLGQDYFLEARVRIFESDQAASQLAMFKQDSYVQVNLAWYF